MHIVEVKYLTLFRSSFFRYLLCLSYLRQQDRVPQATLQNNRRSATVPSGSAASRQSVSEERRRQLRKARFVWRGVEGVGRVAEKSGTFADVASECLKKLPTTHTKFTYNWDGLTFNFLVEGPFTYCVVATDAAKRNLPNALLERVKDDFTKRYAGGKAANAYANSLSKEFGPKMKEHMQYFVIHPEEVNQLAKVQAQVAEVKETMIANIDKVIERGGKIDILIDKTENLRSQAKEFKQGGTQLKRKMWLNNMKIKLTVLGILIALILIIFFSACGGLRCTK